MLVSDAAKRLGISAQTLRLALQQDKFPFGKAIRTSQKRYTYWISESLLERYLEGNAHETNDANISTPVVLDKLWTEDDAYY